jgi:hypothetical protein
MQMSSTLLHGNRRPFNLSLVERNVTRSDYAAIQEHLSSPAPLGRCALDLSMDEVNASVGGPPRPPSP